MYSPYKFGSTSLPWSVSRLTPYLSGYSCSLWSMIHMLHTHDTHDTQTYIQVHTPCLPLPYSSSCIRVQPALCQLQQEGLQHCWTCLPLTALAPLVACVWLAGWLVLPPLCRGHYRLYPIHRACLEGSAPECCPSILDFLQLVFARDLFSVPFHISHSLVTGRH